MDTHSLSQLGQQKNSAWSVIQLTHFPKQALSLRSGSEREGLWALITGQTTRTSARTAGTNVSWSQGNYGLGSMPLSETRCEHLHRVRPKWHLKTTRTHRSRCG